jgi:hypothetical protein
LAEIGDRIAFIVCDNRHKAKKLVCETSLLCFSNIILSASFRLSGVATPQAESPFSGEGDFVSTAPMPLSLTGA